MVQLPIVAEANTRDEWVKTPVGDYSIKGAGYILYGEALKNNRGQHPFPDGKKARRGSMPIKRVLIFQDGTSNTKFSDTNVSKLYEMVLKDSDQFKKY